MPSGLLLVHFHPVSLVELGGMSRSPALIRDRLSLTREGKLWCKVCLHPHLEQGGMPPIERWHWSLFFFLSYRWELTIPASLLWTVSWKTWNRFDPQAFLPVTLSIVFKLLQSITIISFFPLLFFHNLPGIVLFILLVPLTNSLILASITIL